MFRPKTRYPAKGERYEYSQADFLRFCRRVRGGPEIPSAGAWPNCGIVFNDTYQNNTYQNSQTEANAGCQTCHQSASGGGNFNVYGNDLLAQGANGVGPGCPADIFVTALRAVEALDSDQETTTNLAEIIASARPGWRVAAEAAPCTNSSGTPPDVLLDPAATNNAPIAVGGGPYAGEAGTTLIQFDGSASRDPDDDPLTFAWDFGDGTSATGMNPTHTYSRAGNFQVTLVVNDGQTDSAPSVTAATISEPPMNIAPTADPGGLYTGTPGQPISFSGGASSDPNDDVLTYTWDFGDGAMGTGASATHTFSADGIYTVSLTVSDGQASSSATTTATITTQLANRAPTADAGGPYTGDAGAIINFSGSASRDPEDDTLTYRWDFGDGTTGSGVSPGHAYSEAGTYRVTLVVSDGKLESVPATTSAEIIARISDVGGSGLYRDNCAFCHGDPWSEPAVDGTLPGLRRVAGARACNISASIFGNSVFPNGVPDMQFLHGLGEPDITAISDYLNTRDTTGRQRYVTTCAGCHGNDGSGGRVGEDVHGDSANETFEAIAEEGEMRYLGCMPESDIMMITDFLMGMDADNDDDGIAEDEDDDNDGVVDSDDSDDDNDGMSDDDEREYGTDPRDDDTDDDGVNDGDERENGTDPLDRDTDDDGLDDGEERDRGTDPRDADSDDDGVSDGDEVTIFDTNPLVANNAGQPTNTGGGSTGLVFLLLLAMRAFRERRHSAGNIG